VQESYSRREFLKLSGLGALAALLPPLGMPYPPENDPPPHAVGRARVTTTAIYRYSKPDFSSERTGMLHRDEILPVYGRQLSPHGPQHNPLWYQLEEGYVHIGYLQRVDGADIYPHILEHIPRGGRLGQITVPYSDSYRFTPGGGWQRLYRLYYQSVYWITAVDEGPDGKPWYRLADDLLHVRLHVPAVHVRPIDASEITPLSPHVPAQEKRIEISLATQTLSAYEGDQIVFLTQVSTGLPSDGPSPNGIPTDTPPGRFRVSMKMPSRHMGDGRLTDDIEAYELLGVPWDCFFHKDGLALHGTYWHNNFGRQMSHGCVNLRNEDALWLYRWTTPVASFQDRYTQGRGTVIDIKS